MQDRRTFLGFAAAALLPASFSSSGIDAQAPAPRPVAELARHALTGPFEGYEVVLVELNPAPGSRAAGPGHRHPGAVLGYVVEGQLRFAINNEPEKVLPAGGTFFEPSGAVHTSNGSARSDGPTRAVVFMLVPKGSPLTAPA
jgi:quercetin dioxygenase-like cupin family protein